MTVKILRQLAGLLLSLSLISFSHAAQMLDRVVAVVDDDIVMESELNEQIEMVTKNIERQGAAMPPAEEIYREVLNKMIVESLQLQIARRAGVQISDAQLNQAMGTVASQMGASLDQFREQLLAEGSYYQTREQIRREMILRQVQNGSLSGKVLVTQPEIEAFLASNEGQQLTQARYRLSHILLPLTEDVSEDTVDSALSQLDTAAEEIRAGMPLLQWLSLYNQTSNKPLEGGDLGWRTADEMPSLFVEAVTEMGRGEVEGPLRSPAGLHLLQLADTTGGAKLVDQTKARHILVKTSEIRTEEQCQVLLSSIREQIMAGSDFAELARKYTEDIGTAQEGGDLGWSQAGQFVPEFEQTMAITEIDEISEPFRSPFGWHIIQVVDRRQHDVREDMLKEQAYGYIYDRKFQQELETWLQKIRDEAYVDIKG
ncbi:MAG: peptidylprolyl isomerase [Pseudomonadales bacterium]